MPPTRTRRLRAASGDARAAASAAWPVMTALGVEDPSRIDDSSRRDVTGKQIQAAADIADKLLRAEESRAVKAEDELDRVREQRDRALILLRRLGDVHYQRSSGYADAAALAALHEASSALIGEVGVLDLDRDVRNALANVLADGPALEAAVAAALDAAVVAPPAGTTSLIAQGGRL